MLCFLSINPFDISFVMDSCFFVLLSEMFFFFVWSLLVSSIAMHHVIIIDILDALSCSNDQ
jgi:hypothetical protein